MEWDTQAMREMVLQNDVVQLRPVSLSDKEGYARIVYDPEIWQYFVSVISDESGLDGFLNDAVRDSMNGTRIVFTIVERKSGRIAGSTAYGNLAPKERRLEIGWSWLGKEFRGTGINRAVKHLLLSHAFEELQCERVEFKTDELNARARRGLLAIGAKEEGTLRSFNYMPGGRRRNAVYYSILKNEWPEIRKGRGHD